MTKFHVGTSTCDFFELLVFGKRSGAFRVCTCQLAGNRKDIYGTEITVSGCFITMVVTQGYQAQAFSYLSPSRAWIVTLDSDKKIEVPPYFCLKVPTRPSAGISESRGF